MGAGDGAGPQHPPDTTGIHSQPWGLPRTDTQKELIMSFIETHDVVGMTCDHCVRAVRTEVSAIEGVTDVDVDLTRGVVRVTAEQPVPTSALRDAVEEAGYTLP